MNSCLYRGVVLHKRNRPRRHQFRYQVTAWFIDLDELPELDRQIRGFGWNRPAPVSFHDSDHGARDGGDLRGHVERCLARHSIPRPARIGLLCYPRMFGYTFNPLSIYYCFDQSGALIATLHEVSNTFGQTHTYVIGTGDSGSSIQHQAASKRFYVSPFMPMNCEYRFRLSVPDSQSGLTVGIRQSDPDGHLFNAVFVADRVPMDRYSAIRLVLGSPWMTLKITVGIHYEALRLWLKRVPLVARPAPPARATTGGISLTVHPIEETRQ